MASETGAEFRESEYMSRDGAGKFLYRGKADYRLRSWQSTLNLAVGKEENKK